MEQPKMDYIEELKNQIECLEIKLFELKQELKEKENYQTLESLDIEY